MKLGRWGALVVAGCVGAIMNMAGCSSVSPDGVWMGNGSILALQSERWVMVWDAAGGLDSGKCAMGGTYAEAESPADSFSLTSTFGKQTASGTVTVKADGGLNADITVFKSSGDVDGRMSLALMALDQTTFEQADGKCSECKTDQDKCEK